MVDVNVGVATVRLGDMTVNRLGFGSMQLIGDGVWGPPAYPDDAVRVLRRAVELGVTFIDTADSYGPSDSEELIRRALYPYPDGLVIGTKGGMVRPGPGLWEPLGRPAYLRQCVEMSLRRLGVECLDLFQLHRVDANVPLLDQIGELRTLRDEGKIRHIGLSEVSLQVLQEARDIVEIASVQNIYNVRLHHHDEVVDYAAENGIVFIPFFPLNGGDMGTVALPHGFTVAQLMLGWLLRRSPAILAIPGTHSLAHLEENMATVGLDIPNSAFDALEEAAAR
jgi:pyridoxine 4-dehydrogenase